MRKQLRDFLKKEVKEKKKWSKEHRYCFLDDYFREDPHYICPRCESDEVRSLNTHNVDGWDHMCNNCGLTYEILYYDRVGDCGH